MGCGALGGYPIRVFQDAYFRVEMYPDAGDRQGNCAAQVHRNHEVAMAGSLKHAQDTNWNPGCASESVRSDRELKVVEAVHGSGLVWRLPQHLSYHLGESEYGCTP